MRSYQFEYKEDLFPRERKMAAEAVGDPEGSKLIKESSSVQESVQESGGDFRNGQEEKEKEGGENRREEDKLAQRVIEIMEKDNIEEKEKEKSHLKKGESTTSVDTETIAKEERKDKEDPQKEEKTEDIENKKNQRGKEKGGIQVGALMILGFITS